MGLNCAAQMAAPSLREWSLWSGVVGRAFNGGGRLCLGSCWILTSNTSKFEGLQCQFPHMVIVVSLMLVIYETK